MLDALSIVVTHYRSPDVLKVCLAHLMQFAPGASIIVVNSGADDTLKMVQLMYPEVKGLEVPGHSYGAVVNAGFKRCETPYILQMNADVYLRETTLADLLKVLEQKGIGVVGPRCFNKRGRLQQQGILYRRYYSLLRLTRATALPVSWLSGCCQMFKRELLNELGGFDSTYRFYNEDLDWCTRVRRAGWRCELVSTDVTHLGGSATPSDAKFIVEGYRGGMVFARRYRPGWFQRLQRTFVMTEARVKATSKDAVVREAYRQILAMFEREAYNESPFGATLNEANPKFLKAIGLESEKPAKRVKAS